VLTLDMTHDCYKFVRALDAKPFRQVMTAVLGLMQDPSPHDAAALTQTPYLRVDCGEYRIIYYVDGQVLRVVLIGKRNDDDVYKRLRRLLR
jgi:mRNA interferase RelE/StbE